MLFFRSVTSSSSLWCGSGVIDIIYKFRDAVTLGHTIKIEYSKNKKRTVVNPQGNEGETVSAIAKAYKFGKKDAEMSTKPMHRVRNTIDARSKKTQAKTDHEMRNYLHALEHFTHMGSQWVTCFANELGSGIVTKENEIRMVV